MKDMLKNKKLLAIIGGGLIVLAIMITCIVLNVNKKEDAPIHKEETHNMFVKINPLVKLTFKEEYYLCKNDDGEEEICGEQSYKVSEYELINDDAKTFYKDLEFTNKDLYEVLLMLCETARDNNVGFESLELTTDSDNITNENVLEYLKSNSKYEVSYSVYVNFEEHINEDDILKNEDTEISKFLITFDSDGGSKVENQTIEKGNKISKPANPTKDGYIFVEWQLDGKTFDFNTEIKGDITLKAKWKKENTGNNNQNNNSQNSNTSQNQNENNNTSNNNSENNNTSDNNSENKPSITSTLDKVNLNDNILVGQEYYGILCGFRGFITSDIKEVFPNATENSKNDWYIDSLDKFGEPVQEYLKLQFDTNKENNMDAQMKKIQASKMPWGVKYFDYSFSNHQIKYEWSALYLIDYQKYGDFGKAWYNEKTAFEKTIKNAVNGSQSINTACGGFGDYEPKVLNEALCSEYHINCGRW